MPTTPVLSLTTAPVRDEYGNVIVSGTTPLVPHGQVDDEYGNVIVSGTTPLSSHGKVLDECGYIVVPGTTPLIHSGTEIKDDYQHVVVPSTKF